jgi:hypothetical protein
MTHTPQLTICDPAIESFDPRKHHTRSSWAQRYFIDSPEAAACHIRVGVDHIPAVVGARKPQAAVAVATAVQRYGPTEFRPTPVEGLNAEASFVTTCGPGAN